jgi:nitrous oxide reductase accessory protein NosL
MRRLPDLRHPREQDLERVILLLGVGVLILGLQGLAACSRDPGTGPVDVKWDRYTCERCRMVLSDRKHAAEVRVHPSGGRSKVHFFDDIGCAVVWLEDKPFRDAAGTEIWVTDWRTGHWIDARNASYVLGQVTPMEYGLGAQSESRPGALSFEQAKAHIFEVERHNAHGSHSEAAAR